MRTRYSTYGKTLALMALLGLTLGLGACRDASDAPPDNTANGTAPAQTNGNEPDRDDVSEEDLSAWGGFGNHQEVQVCADESVETTGLMQYWPGDGAVGSERKGYVACTEKAVDEFKKANPDSNKVHEAVMTVEIPQDGTWYPWVLTWWYDDCGNSVYVRITGEDGRPVQKPVLVEDATTKTWHWKRASGTGLELKKGTYKVGIINREDGARVRSMLFTTRAYDSYTPVNPEG